MDRVHLCSLCGRQLWLLGSLFTATAGVLPVELCPLHQFEYATCASTCAFRDLSEMSPIFSDVMEIVHLCNLFLSWYYFGQEGNFKKCSGWCFCVLMAVVGVQRLGLSSLPKI